MEGECNKIASSDAPSFTVEESNDKDSTIPLYIVIGSPSENDACDKLDVNVNPDKNSVDIVENSKIDIVEAENKSSTSDIDNGESLQNNEQNTVENISETSAYLETIAVEEKKEDKLLGPVMGSPKSDGSQKPKISRELKGLQKAAAESKIITEFTNITEKMRSRKTLNSPNTNRLKEPEGGRKSSDSCKLIETVCITDVASASKKDNERSPKSTKAKLVGKTSEQKKQNLFGAKGQNSDIFCWQCHQDGVDISCKTCPRSFHMSCLKGSTMDTEDWCCFECLAIIHAETTDTRSYAMKQMSLTHFCELLKFALRRMTDYVGQPLQAEPFLNPVDKVEFPDYAKYVVHPMDLSQLEHNIKKNLYGSTEAFIADTKWILHNSIIYNSFHTKVTSVAKGIIKVCKQEMNEIETCPECYLKANSNTDTNWFLEVCSQPHMLVWAKLKGYPYWPAKAMTVASNGLVDVRFFGAHDKAWIPMKDCLLYSEKDPNFSDKGKRSDFVESVKELGIYIKNLEKRFGKFCYAPFKTPYPADQEAIYNMMLPSYKYNPSERILKGIKSPVKNNKLNKSAMKAEPHKEDSKNVKNVLNEADEDSVLDGYGTEDDEIPNRTLKDSSKSDMGTSENSENDIPIKISPLRGSVRMRGGKINSTGRIRTMNMSRKAELDKTECAPKLSPQKEPIKNGEKSYFPNDSTKGTKRKISTESIESSEKKLKQDTEKNINATLLIFENLEIKSKANAKLEKSESVTSSLSKTPSKSGMSNNENDVNSSPNKPSGELKKPFKIMDKLPQISIMGLPKGITIEKTNSSIKSRDLQTGIGQATVILRKRSSLLPNQSGGKKPYSITETKIDETSSIPKTFSISSSISIENLDKNAKNLNEQLKTKTNSISVSTEIPKISAITLVPEVKTEPIEYEIVVEDTDASSIINSAGLNMNEISLKKQSARKSFPNNISNISDAENVQNVSKKMVPDSMVHIHETCVPNPSQNLTQPPLNYQMASSVIETFTISRSCDITKTLTTDSLSTAVSTRESNNDAGQQQDQLQPSSSQPQVSCLQLQPASSQLQLSSNQLQLFFSQPQASGSQLQPSSSRLHLSFSPLQPSCSQLQLSFNQPQPSCSQPYPSCSQPYPSCSQPEPSSSKQKTRVMLGPLTTPLPARLPSDCGPVTKLLNENALKMSDYFRSLIQETLVDFAQAGSTDARVKELEAKIEDLKWVHTQRMREFQHNTELIISEMRNSVELANARALAEQRKQIEDQQKKSK